MELITNCFDINGEIHRHNFFVDDFINDTQSITNMYFVIDLLIIFINELIN